MKLKSTKGLVLLDVLLALNGVVMLVLFCCYCRYFLYDLSCQNIAIRQHIVQFYKGDFEAGDVIKTPITFSLTVGDDVVSGHGEATIFNTQGVKDNALLVIGFESDNDQ